MNDRSRRERHFLKEDSALPRHGRARRKCPTGLPDDGECGCQNEVSQDARFVRVGSRAKFCRVRRSVWSCVSIWRGLLQS
jgi:hypothetical protein